MYEFTNTRRARRALATLQAYDGQDNCVRIELDVNQDTFDEVVSDLLGDILHLADRLGVRVDLEALVERGWTRYHDEILEDEPGDWAAAAMDR